MNHLINIKITRDKLTIAERAYAAGLFDGEGSVTIGMIRRNNPNYKCPQHVLVVTCTNGHKPTIEWLHKKFGSSKAMRKRFGQNLRWRACYGWNATANKALYFLEIVLPYLKVKKDQAELGIRFQKEYKIKRKFIHSDKTNGHTLSLETVQWREQFAQRMQKLNKREWL